MYTEVKALLLFAINASQTALIAVCSFNICRTNLLKGRLQHNSFQTETVGGGGNTTYQGLVEHDFYGFTILFYFLPKYI